MALIDMAQDRTGCQAWLREDYVALILYITYLVIPQTLHSEYKLPCLLYYTDTKPYVRFF